MKSFVYIALVVFLGTVAVQGYGPKIHRIKHGGPYKSSHLSHNRPSHGSHHGPPQRPHHHGSPQRPHHRPHDNSFGPPNQHGHWDNSYLWDDRSDSRDSSEDRGSYDSYSPDDIYDPDNSYSTNDYSRERDSSDRSGPSYEDYGDRYDHHHSKYPCKPPHNKKPPKTTRKPIPTPKPIPTTPKPIPTTQKSIPTTHRIPLTPNLPPHPTHARFTPKPTGTTAVWRPNPTTPQIIPRSTKTIGPIPRSPITTASRPTWYPTTPTENTTHWETTTNSVPETTSFIPVTTPSNPGVETTTAEGVGFPTISPEIEECINTCLSTPEYNPVCGSNGVTYDNEGKLFCARSCGVDVTLVRRSACPPPNDGGETSPRTQTTTPFHGRTASLSDFQRCMRLCRITSSFTPVCGTDLVTYMNMDRLKCAQSCGEVVEVLCEKPCAACGFNPVTPKTTTLRPSTTTQIGRTTQEPDEQECINACPVTSEYNPVCGSNQVTYSNPSHLVCAQLCGVGVAVARLGPCGPTTTSSTTTVAPPPTLSPDVLNCIRRCPVTTEYDPVCGSDDLTYNNLGNLHCSKFCGVEVDFKHKTRCVNEFDLGPDGTDSTPSQPTQDINGTKDHVTTPSPSTATTTSLFTSLTTTTTATLPTTLKSTSTTNASPNSSSTLGFTIPEDVLIDIFGSTTAQAPTTKPNNPDEDEDLDLYVRFNNKTDTDKDTDRSDYSKIIFPD